MKSKLLSKRVLVLFILLLGFSPLSQAFAQFGITGTVTDWARNPIIGATVVIQGTNIGTTTDFDGHYTIYAIPGDTLVFSYLGMKNMIFYLSIQLHLYFLPTYLSFLYISTIHVLGPIIIYIFVRLYNYITIKRL